MGILSVQAIFSKQFTLDFSQFYALGDIIT